MTNQKQATHVDCITPEGGWPASLHRQAEVCDGEGYTETARLLRSAADEMERLQALAGPQAQAGDFADLKPATTNPDLDPFGEISTAGFMQLAGRIRSLATSPLVAPNVGELLERIARRVDEITSPAAR